MKESATCFRETDVSNWKHFPIEGGYVVITDAGQEKIKNDHEFLELLGQYRRDVRYVMNNVRQHFRSGGNSDVYHCGGHTVIKEVIGTQSAYFAMQRAENVRCLCDQVLPNYVSVPRHYALIFSTKLPRQYLIMEKVDDGITIEDIKEQNLYPEFRDDIKASFYELKRILFSIDGIKQIVTDFHEGNIVVDFSTPTTEKPYTFWLLDQ